METTLHHFQRIGDLTLNQPTVTFITVVPFSSSAALLLLQNKACDLIESWRHQLPARSHVVKRSKTEESHYFFYTERTCADLCYTHSKTEKHYKLMCFVLFWLFLSGGSKKKTELSCLWSYHVWWNTTEIQSMEQVLLWWDHTCTGVSVGQWCYKYTPQLFLWPVETF